MGFTSKQRDQIVAALRLLEAVQPFIAFAKSGSFKLFGDGFVLTNGSQTRRQLTAGDFRGFSPLPERKKHEKTYGTGHWFCF